MTKLTKKCIKCNQPFNRPELTCWRCGACQGCKKYVADRLGNYCEHCKGHVKQARYDQQEQPTMHVFL